MNSTKIFMLAFAAFLLFGFVNSQGAMWQSIVDNKLLGAGFKQAAIIGKADGSILAASPNFNPTEKERQTLIHRFNDYSYADLDLNRQKYIVIKSDDRSIYGKKGTGGALCVRTSSVVLVAVYDNQLKQGKAANIIETVADGLIENGY